MVQSSLSNLEQQGVSTVASISSTVQQTSASVAAQLVDQLTAQSSAISSQLVSSAESKSSWISNQFSSLSASLKSQVSDLASSSSEKAVAVVTAAGPALSRATSTFSSELEDSMVTLGSNLCKGVGRASDAILRLTSNTFRSLAPPSSPPVYATAPIPSTPSTASSAASSPSLLSLAQSSLNRISEQVGKWSLFADPDHWENGYWERQIRAMQSIQPEEVLQKSITVLEKGEEELKKKEEELAGLTRVAVERLNGVGTSANAYLDSHPGRNLYYSHGSKTHLIDIVFRFKAEHLCLPPKITRDRDTAQC